MSIEIAPIATNHSRTAGGTPDLDSVLRELDSLRAALASLGLKQCTCCRKYYRANPQNLLSAGQAVCFRCFEDWWRRYSPSLQAEERCAVERQILRWLVAHHGARVIRHAKDLPEAEAVHLKVVVACEHCAGRGRHGDRACENCHGRGSEWVVIPKFP